MISLRRSPVLAIRTPWSYSRSCVSRNLSTGAHMPSKILPTLSLQGKVSNGIVFPTQKQVFMERQVCLVTGAARGLGNEFCRAFMRS